MAPILVKAVGITPQIIDDENIRQLRTSLLELKTEIWPQRTFSSSDEVPIPEDIDRLVELLETVQRWIFEEQVDLREWIEPLNKIDACLSYYIEKYPSLLLIGPVKRSKSLGAVKPPIQLLSKPADSVEDLSAVPEDVNKNVCTIVRFLASLLLNASNKSVFNSVEELVDLLGAADDSVAAVALQALSSLAMPPSIHKQQTPDIQQHATALHTSRTTSHKRLIALARGWGTRGSGLGLYTCATSDDSEFGQGALPIEAGEVNFAFFRHRDAGEEGSRITDLSDGNEGVDDSYLVRIALQGKEIVNDSGMVAESSRAIEENDDANKQKRRRVAAISAGEHIIRSTAELFFTCVEKAGGRDQIPKDRLFPLLADIRLARSFHCRETRIAAVERRLRALIAILHTHPSQEVMSGYFQAQPELCVELIDLLRPTVSSASVSAASSNRIVRIGSVSRHDGISTLANSSNVPYDIRKLALDTLSALVARRDGSNGALTGAARHSNVLTELGVGKGQYLGILPTLIRFSLAALGSLRSTKRREEEVKQQMDLTEDTIAVDLGLAFVETTAQPPLSRSVQLQRALEFIESVLTLTAAVVSTPAGTSALTECGLIPALLINVTADNKESISEITSGFPGPDGTRVRAQLQFVTAQAVQILEGAIVTHGNALTAFHDLQGVEILTARLSKEIAISQEERQASSRSVKGSSAMDSDTQEMETDDSRMDADSSLPDKTKIHSSHRVLLFSIVTLLTVVFHQESTSSSVVTPSGATELRKPELTTALIEILDNVDVYGGHLASLIATLLSDVMNSDPHVVHHVHESGLAPKFLGMLNCESNGDPTLPAVPELIMAIPNVLSALALTENGAKAVKEANPFPSLLSLFYHPKYAMPRSRCLLNEMTAIVGTGLDEIMRHVTQLRPLICEAISHAMIKVAEYGDDLNQRESASSVHAHQSSLTASELENERSCLIQYVLNFGQILEQILQNEDHCEPFVAVGGLESLLKLYPYTMPNGVEFLSHLSCLSCPSVSTLTHATSEDSLTLAFKCVALRYDSSKLIKTMIKHARTQVTKVEQSQKKMRKEFPVKGYKPENDIDATLVLNGLPREPMYSISKQGFASESIILSNYLQQVVTLQWVTSLLSAVIKASCQRSQEIGTGWSRSEREWKKELSSTSFEELFGRLSNFHQTTIFEVCRVRTEEGYEERDRKRLAKSCKERRLQFRLRIVCPEGAVVRDGIEIDSCASVGCMEMGEITCAFDRCVNSSGVLRYRTDRGWVSEQTRGHGREPIAEVLAVSVPAEGSVSDATEFEATGRIEAGVPDICTASANVLARSQTSYSDFFSAMARVVVQGARSLPTRTIAFQPGSIGGHVSSMIKLLKSEISNGFSSKHILASMKSHEPDPVIINRAGSSMYLGSLLSHLRSCLFEEKRERRMVNVPLLLSLFNANTCLPRDEDMEFEISFIHAIIFIFKESLGDFETRAVGSEDGMAGDESPKQTLSRTTAACLPAANSILRRLLSGSAITASPASSVLSRIKHTDLKLLLGVDELTGSTTSGDSGEETFSPENFVRTLLCTISEAMSGVWSDPRLVHSPPYVTHPIATIVSEMIVGLDDATKKAGGSTSRNSDDPATWGTLRGLIAGNRAAEGSGANVNPPEEFEPSDEAISRLEEMGFSRDHAWDAIYSTRSNVLEIAMEYALSHPPASASTIQRRRAAIEERRRRREQAETPSGNSAETGAREGAGSQRTAPSVDANEEANAMEVDQSNESNEKDTAKEEEKEEPTMTKAKTCLNFWKKEATIIACEVIAGTPTGCCALTDATLSNEGNGEVEASTVVLCSFLLDLCQRYPEERNRIVSELIERLTTQITEEEIPSGTVWKIRPGKEASFASLCHGTVLFTRALPKLRTLVLKKNLVHKLVSCIETHWASNKVQDIKSNFTAEWPMWLAPALLLLDIMAQPVVAFSDADFEGSSAGDTDSTKNEWTQVKEEHRVQSNALAQLADDLFSSLYEEKHGPESKQFEEKNQSPSCKADEEKNTGEDNTTTAESRTAESSSQDSLFKSVPAYFPLLPCDTAEASVDLCIRIVSSSTPAPPGIIHASLLLLLRLLRAPRFSSYCLKNGLADKILALPHSCRFTGHTGLATLIFRRLLEDETSLQVAMETEIRGTITKLLGKKNGTSIERERQSVPSRSFIQGITPLLCRDPTSFLKAVAVSLRFEKKGSDNDTRVYLLSSSERAKHMRLANDALKNKHGAPTPNSKGLQHRKSHGHRQRRGSNAGSRGKTPTRSNKRGASQKRMKKDKAEAKEKQDEDLKPFALATPATQITALLINHAVQRSTEQSKSGAENESTASFDFGSDSTFLWAANILEMLADLVLAIPACATAIHRFRPSKHSKDRSRQQPLAHPSHALRGCPNPPKTFVSYLLHVLLTQDRWNNGQGIKDTVVHETDGLQESKTRRKVLFRRTQVSQYAARLLVALVARPGDVRRRVISELVFALSGGELGFVSVSPSSLGLEKSKLQFRESEMHALHAWGELCVGLAAPRSNGSNYEGNSMLSFEVVKIMLDSGMAHALLLAVHRVDLHHPLSAATIGSLVLPFEILSRPSVGDVMKTLETKEASAKEAKEATRASKQASTSLDDGFADESGRGSIDHVIDDSFVAVSEAQAERDDSGETMLHDNENGEAEAEMDIEDDEGSSDEDMSSNEGSSESSVEDSEDDDHDDDDEDSSSDGEEDDESILEDSEESNSDEGFDEDAEINADYRVDMLAETDPSEYEGAEPPGVDANIDEGWTRIESSGFGGMLMGSRRGMGQPVGGFGAGMTSRTRGFIDAAEAMIGTLLRTGEIHSDALAEIEGSLGIRIMPGGRGLATAGDGSNRSDGPFGDTLGPRQMSAENRGASNRGRHDVVGTFPQIHQRSQPDVGHSALGGGGRWNEISSMEYVYGGPSITAGSRNYDLVSPVVVPNVEEDASATVSQMEVQLFPGGPSSATLQRTQLSLHPLLCGVDLPPVNALVSDLLPHGARATRRGQMSTRRPGDWTTSSFSGGGMLVSTSNGSIVRSNRGASMSMAGGGRGVSRPVGWTDEGLPFDATVEEFSTAFESALQESMTSTRVTEGTNDNGGSNSAEQPESQSPPTAEGDGIDTLAPAESPVSTAESAEAENSNIETRGSQDAQLTEANDGDGVASSLAAGLRLSPQSDDNDGHTAPNEEQRASLNDSQVQDNQEIVDADAVEATANSSNMDTDPIADVAQEAHQENQDNAGQEPSNASVGSQPNFNGLVCPPGVDPEVFNHLPIEMQQEVADQARATSDLAAQLDAESSLDPEALAALPESMRREVIEQEQQERRRREREQAPADPANAEEMDNASFVASLAPELRTEILLTADDTFLQSLPPNIIAEAQILRERATSHRRAYEGPPGGGNEEPAGRSTANAQSRSNQNNGVRDQGEGAHGSARRKQRAGKLRVETDRGAIVYLPTGTTNLSKPVAITDLKALLRFLYLISPVRPHRLLQKVFQNICTNGNLRLVVASTFVKLLQDDNKGALESLKKLRSDYSGPEDWRSRIDAKYQDSLSIFPPQLLIGAAPDVLDTDGLNPNITLLRRKQNNDTAAAIAANLPMSARGSRHEQSLPPVVATRIVDTLQQMCKGSPRFCLDMLVSNVNDGTKGDSNNSTAFELLIDLLEKPRYSKSSANLEQLLILLEYMVSPLSHLTKHGEEDIEISQRDIDSAAAAGKEWADVPRIAVSLGRLQLLCSILRMETCRDTSFTKVNTIARRLCRIEANRGFILSELASVACALGADAVRDLKALSIRLSAAVTTDETTPSSGDGNHVSSPTSESWVLAVGGKASSSVAVSTSTSELKLLRVLQTLQALCVDTTEETSKKNDGFFVTEELADLLIAMNLDELWAELTSCLKVVQVLEGVNMEEDAEKTSEDPDAGDGEEENNPSGKKLQNSVAGLLTRFLPSIESFFVANASATRGTETGPKEDGQYSTDGKESQGEKQLRNLVGGAKLVEFVTANKVLLNALIRNNAGLLDKGLKALIQVPHCRHLLDFDVKRHWFKTQMRRLRQQASRRHGSLRLHIRRRHVFEDAYHQLRLRNAEEMRGRLHITFRNEEGVDAGGLSREFFGILGKEIFNPNYALFTSTEDGSTFQPNPNSSINPDHLSYFRFVGRIVGKAVSDGYLLDAHFTRSLYKHMLGIKPTHHDMEAIDPDYYKNLKTILEYDLGDLGLDLTFSIEDHSFGRNQTLDLIPNGRDAPVTEQNKSKYVSLVCQHRMTTAISSQIKAYLDGFYELVNPDLVAIFTPREIELLISGLPDIDVNDLKQNTDYVGWKATDNQIQWFWNVLFSLTRNQKASFLQFVTGSSKVPLAGFGELPGMRGVQKFSIHKASGSTGALMSAHTCFNSLDLPAYASEEELREKLLYAINEGGGTFLMA